MCRRNKLLLLFALLCLALGLCAAFLPYSDIDHDGLPDSPVSEGLALLPALFALAGLSALFARLATASLGLPLLRFSLPTPPPIAN